MKITVLVVDDEAPDRELLKSLISTYCEHFFVIGEAGSVTEAVTKVNELLPAVVMLDIEMPGEQGFDLLARFPERAFLPVMTTGYDQYGIRAIKAGAFDYLLKPIDVDELIETEGKVLRHLQPVSTDTSSSTLKVYHQGERLVLRVSDIVFAEAHGSYTSIHLQDGTTVLASRNLVAILSDLPGQLVRIHRSHAINLKYVRSFQSLGNEGLITLHPDHVLKVGRKYKADLKGIWS